SNLKYYFYVDIKTGAGGGGEDGRALALEKARGSETASQTDVKQARPDDLREPERPAVVVERAPAEADPGIYSLPPRSPVPPSAAANGDAPACGRGGSSSVTELHIGTLIQLGADGRPSTTILGDGATLEISLHIGTFVRLGAGGGSARAEETGDQV